MNTELQTLAVAEYKSRFGHTPRGIVAQGASENIVMVCDNLTTLYFIFSGKTIVDIQVD